MFYDKNHYIPEILSLFSVAPEVLFEYNKRNKLMNRYDPQLITGKRFHKNSPFISVYIYKQVWIVDHYVFYMDIRTADGKDFSITNKRYSDFYEFN